MKKLVFSAFPGVGKTHFYNECRQKGYRGFEVSDSDSSTFDKSRFPKNYIEHIKDLLSDDKDRIILVSSHDSVRNAMKEAGIDYHVVAPTFLAYTEYMHRYRNRGSSPQFIQLMARNFDEFLDSCIDEENSTFLHEEWYFSDFIENYFEKFIK